jgi:hypothetical protein
VESAFVRKSALAALQIGHVRGVILLAACRSGAMIYEYTAPEVKMAVVRQGAAAKEQVAFMVRRLLPGVPKMTEDESDALAVAVGTAHGLYRGEPKIEYELLDRLVKAVPVPLVLHGGSSTGDERLREAVLRGVRKVNIFTDMSVQAVADMKKAMAEDERATVLKLFGVARPSGEVRRTTRTTPTRRFTTCCTSRRRARSARAATRTAIAGTS